MTSPRSRDIHARDARPPEPDSGCFFPGSVPKPRYQQHDTADKKNDPGAEEGPPQPVELVGVRCVERIAEVGGKKVTGEGSIRGVAPAAVEEVGPGAEKLEVARVDL